MNLYDQKIVFEQIRQNLITLYEKVINLQILCGIFLCILSHIYLLYTILI